MARQTAVVGNKSGDCAFHGGSPKKEYGMQLSPNPCPHYRRRADRLHRIVAVRAGDLGPPAGNPGLGKAAPAATENVQYRRWHGGGYRGFGYHHHHGDGGAAALIGSLAASAIIGGAIAAGQANAAAQQNAAYCARRYRSYDPASGTYLNNDGNRYPCP